MELNTMKKAMADHLEEQARYRERVAEEYPDDLRNARAARELRLLAEELRTDWGAVPAHRFALLAEARDIEPHSVVSISCDSGFDPSKFCFHAPNEDAWDFLHAWADAAYRENPLP